MKSPIDIVTGKIVGYDDRRGDLLVRVPYDDYPTLIRRGYRECLVQLKDSRPLSDKQRRTCYALMRAIADYTGNGEELTKEYMKVKFLVEDVEQTGEQLFSLSNAPMSLVCAFQRFLVRFIVDWDIPTEFSLLGMVDDIPDYVYACLINKRCCICGCAADLHHVDRIGMGYDRTDVIHEGLEVLPLCRSHHTEAHTMPDAAFFGRYHLDGGIVMDRTLCRLYGLRTKKGAGA